MDEKLGSALRPRRPPLFLRIFAMMIAVLLAAQALNFAIVLMVRLPAPQVHATADIAEALQGGPIPDGLAVVDTRPPAPSRQDRRDLRVRDHIASLLGVGGEEVRVIIARPPQFANFDPEARAKPIETTRPRAGHDDIVVGAFTAALRQSDGRWRVVRARGGVEPWQWQALLLLLGAAALAAPFAWLLSRRIAAPINLFAAAAERLGRDPEAPPLDLGGPPELAAAAGAFNAMQTRLRRYVSDRTTMTASIAHDLRTPLMRLSLILEDAGEPTRRQAEAEIRHMKARIASILTFMRGVHTGGERQKLLLRALIDSIADELMDGGAEVSVDGGDAVVIGDAAALKSLFANLIENAVKHGPTAAIRIEPQVGQVIIHIEDNGQGIAESELERVFEPFYRVDAARNRDNGGSGLGLTSARTTARAHGGDIVLSNRPDGGLRATVTLPADPAG